MRSIVFEAELNVENVRNLILDIEKDSDYIELYFSTDGGENSISDFLSNVLNRESSRITLFAGEKISSNGFIVYGKFKGKKFLSKDTCSVVHESWVRTYSYDLSNKNSKGYRQLFDLIKKNKSTHKFYSQFLTRVEMAKFRRGGDIFIVTDRLNDIFSKYDFSEL